MDSSVFQWIHLSKYHLHKIILHLAESLFVCLPQKFVETCAHKDVHLQPRQILRLRILDVIQNGIQFFLRRLAGRYTHDLQELWPIDEIVKLANVLEHLFSNVDAQPDDSLIECLPINTVVKDLADLVFESVGTNMFQTLIQIIQIVGIYPTYIVFFHDIWDILCKQLFIFPEQLLVDGSRLV